jgi:antitoxin HicB
MSNGNFDHSGSTFDSFLDEEHILEETEAIAVKRVLAWKIQQAMRQKNVSKYAMAKELGTSRSQVDRLLDPSHVGVTIGTITRAAMVLGKRVRVDIVSSGSQSRKKEVARTSAKRFLRSRGNRPARQPIATAGD